MSRPRNIAPLTTIMLNGQSQNLEIRGSTRGVSCCRGVVFPRSMEVPDFPHPGFWIARMATSWIGSMPYQMLSCARTSSAAALKGEGRRGQADARPGAGSMAVSQSRILGQESWGPPFASGKSRLPSRRLALGGTPPGRALEGTTGTLGKWTVQKIGMRYVSIGLKSLCLCLETDRNASTPAYDHSGPA